MWLLASTALVLVIDRSGSMQGPRIEAAKEAAAVAIDGGLADGDQVAVIAYDTEAELILPMTKLDKDRKPVLQQMREHGITVGGGTNFLPALQAARDQLHDVKATHKHVIFLTDGEAPSDGVVELVTHMHGDDHDTVTAIGVAGADRTLLSGITEAGDGRLYMVEDLGSLPKIVLKECRLAREAPRSAR